MLCRYTRNEGSSIQVPQYNDARFSGWRVSKISKNSNFENFESALYSISGSIPLCPAGPLMNLLTHTLWQYESITQISKILLKNGLLEYGRLYINQGSAVSSKLNMNDVTYPCQMLVGCYCWHSTMSQTESDSELKRHTLSYLSPAIFHMHWYFLFVSITQHITSASRRHHPRSSIAIDFPRRSMWSSTAQPWNTCDYHVWNQGSLSQKHLVRKPIRPTPTRPGTRISIDLYN